MVMRRLRLAALSARRSLRSAKLFQRRYARLRDNDVRYGVHNGFLIRVTQRKGQHLTTMLDVPIRVVGRRARVRTEGYRRFADFLGERYLSFDREWLFDDANLEWPEDDDGVEQPLAGGSAPLNPSEGVYFGSPPPGTAEPVNIVYAQYHPSFEVADAYQLNGVLLADPPLAYFSEYDVSDPDSLNNSIYPIDPDVHPDGQSLWLQMNYVGRGGKARVFTFSEPWLQQFAPGYRLCSFVRRTTLPSPYVAGALAPDRSVFVQLVLRRTIEPYVMPIEDDADKKSDHGYAALLTLKLAPDDDDAEQGYRVAWSHLWALEDEDDERLRAKARPVVDEGSARMYNGVSENNITPQTKLTPEGYLKSLVTVITSPTAIRLSDFTGAPVAGGSFPELSLVEATWDPDGQFSRRVLESNTTLSPGSYRTGELFTGGWNYEVGNQIVELGDRHNVMDTGGADYIVRDLPIESCWGVYGGAPVALVSYLRVLVHIRDTYEGYVPSESYSLPGAPPVATGSIFYLDTTNRAKYKVVDVETGDALFSWEEKAIGVAPFVYGDRVGDDLIKKGGSFPAIHTSGTLSYAGDGVFAGWAATTDHNTEFPEGELVFVIIDLNEGSVKTKAAPDKLGKQEPAERSADFVHCYQKRTYVDAEKKEEVETPAGFCFGRAGVTYLSTDEGGTWHKIAEVGFFSPILVFSPLWRPEPYDPAGSLGD